MNTGAFPDPQIEQYLLLLRQHLAPMTAAEREDILHEIAAHIQDSMAESNEPAAAVIARLGSPEELAPQYNQGLLLRRASRSFSPVMLLRATLRYASKGIASALVFFCGLVSYLVGVGLAGTALLKLISPSHTGAWVVNGHLVASGTQFVPPAPPAQEILGWWYTPIALVLGSLLCSGTTYAIRAFLRRSRRWQPGPTLHHHTTVPRAI